MIGVAVDVVDTDVDDDVAVVVRNVMNDILLYFWISLKLLRQRRSLICLRHRSADNKFRPNKNISEFRKRKI